MREAPITNEEEVLRVQAEKKMSENIEYSKGELERVLAMIEEKKGSIETKGEGWEKDEIELNILKNREKDLRENIEMWERTINKES